MRRPPIALVALLAMLSVPAPRQVWICRACRRDRDAAVYLSAPHIMPNCARCSAVAELAIEETT